MEGFESRHQYSKPPTGNEYPPEQWAEISAQIHNEILQLEHVASFMAEVGSGRHAEHQQGIADMIKIRLANITELVDKLHWQR